MGVSYQGRVRWTPANRAKFAEWHGASAPPVIVGAGAYRNSFGLLLTDGRRVLVDGATFARVLLDTAGFRTRVSTGMPFEVALDAPTSTDGVAATDFTDMLTGAPSLGH
jgi:hypothetical protein